MSWLVRRVMALRSMPGPCGWSAHGAAGIVVLVVLDVLDRAGRRAPPVGRVVSMLWPGVAMRGGANFMACARGDGAAAGGCRRLVRDAAGIIALVVLDALARFGRCASPLGRVVGMLQPALLSVRCEYSGLCAW